MILKELVGLMDIGCKAMGRSFDGLNVCELGDQRMKWHPAQTGKKYLMEKGVSEHISFDWNGHHGAIKIDLAKVVNEWFHHFDMVTNFGTTEHINKGQYNAFKNIHNFTKVGGVMVHTLPPEGHWKGHCYYNYKPEFYEILASLNDYKCIISEIIEIHGRRGRIQPLVCSVLLKHIDKDFITEEAFEAMGTITEN